MCVVMMTLDMMSGVKWSMRYGEDGIGGGRKGRGRWEGEKLCVRVGKEGGKKGGRRGRDCI